MYYQNIMEFSAQSALIVRAQTTQEEEMVERSIDSVPGCL